MWRNRSEGASERATSIQNRKKEVGSADPALSSFARHPLSLPPSLPRSLSDRVQESISQKKESDAGRAREEADEP